MLKRFLEGLVFGAGFAVAFIVIAATAASLLSPISFRGIDRPTLHTESSVVPAPAVEKPGIRFYELPVEEQIRQASAIALARYEPSSDGKMKAVIREFLKKEPTTTVYYEVGDEYPSASFYPNGDRSNGDGIIIFFVGSPADMKLSVTYSGDRIRGLADIPLELFRDKCKVSGVPAKTTNGA